MKLKTEPYRFQKQDIIQIENLDGRVLIASEMGLGKTLISLVSLYRNEDWLPALVVCPATLKFTWEREAMTHIDLRPSVFESRSPPIYNGSDFSTTPKLAIINYDILHYWVDHIKKLGIKTIIADEAQNLTNPTAKRTKAIRELVTRADRFMALSGTPLTNRPKDLWQILNLLWPEHYKSFWSFAQKYCNPRYRWYGWDFSGADKLPELHTEVKDRGMIRRLKKDVLTDLPSKVRRIIPIEMSNPKEYAEAKDNFMGWLKKNYADRVKRAANAESLVKVGYLLRLCSKLKFDGVVDWVERFLDETDEKLVMFCIHQEAIQNLAKTSAKSVIVDGSVTGRDRQLAVDQFQKDKKTRLFIGNIKAAGVGLTLTAASTVGFAELWYVPGDHTQAEDRIHRIGQKKTAFVNYFVAAGTIEEDLCKILQKKQEVISSVLDGGSMPDDLNVYDELVRTLEEAKNDSGKRRLQNV